MIVFLLITVYLLSITLMAQFIYSNELNKDTEADELDNIIILLLSPVIFVIIGLLALLEIIFFGKGK